MKSYPRKSNCYANYHKHFITYKTTAKGCDSVCLSAFHKLDAWYFTCHELRVFESIQTLIKNLFIYNFAHELSIFKGFLKILIGRGVTCRE